ncbi:MAG: 50S ribosomal protein L29, partial [Phycisphaerae bacterium]|nr:50S ribosomal protein L29 [Phycisphaerae bacterium]
HLFVLRGQSVTEKLEDPSQIIKTRKDIARIKTILRQRELESSKK